ncbi:hypothetical protein ACFL0A_00100 [Patescibacteria group bacterium]
MTKKIYLRTFFLSFLVFVFLFLFWGITCACPSDWQEYSCKDGTGCGEDLFERQHWYWCCESHEECEEVCEEECEYVCVENCWYPCEWYEECEEVCEEDCGMKCDDECGENCWDVCDECCEEIDDWEQVEDCYDWQKCNISQKTCECVGECLEKPENPRYYDNIDPDNPEESLDVNNIYLPVKLDWDNVEYANSYKLQINGVGDQKNRLSTWDYLESSEAIPESCVFQSNSENSWKVIPCCSYYGNYCKDYSDVDTWTFSANSAPELVSPIDPDFEGEKKAEGISLPVTFDWCDVQDVEVYYLRIYREGEEEPYSPFPIPREEGVLPSSFVDDLEFLTKDTYYQWQVAACLEEDASDCADIEKTHSQKWDLATIGDLPIPSLLSPPNDQINPVGLPVTLDWEGIARTNSYFYKITPAILGDEETFVNLSEVTLDWNQLSLNTLYSWKVKPCWDYEGENCEDFSSERHFKTTGSLPELTFPSTNDINISIPVKFDWEDSPGAKSYYLEIADNSSFTNILIPEEKRVVLSSENWIGYPYLKMITNYYWWRVRACADKDGNECGNFSNAQRFTPLRFSPPINLSPGAVTSATPEDVSWNQVVLNWNKIDGAQSYWYVLESDGTNIKDEKTSATSVLISIDPLAGVGKDYKWKVRSCIDAAATKVDNSEICSDWSGWYYFKTIESPQSTAGGIVPCGRDSDNPDTSWNERESCQIKHFFIMSKNGLDFLLWKLGPIILVLLVLGTGAMFYLSLGSLEIIIKAKSMLRAAGIGYLIIFFTWTIINLILSIIGYQVGIFGKWWQIFF